MTIKIIKYFSKKSHLYEKKSNTFPWKYIRLNEVHKFMKETLLDFLQEIF